MSRRHWRCWPRRTRGQAHLEGRLSECEELAHEALARGLAEGSDAAAVQGFGAMIGSIRREQGRVGEIVQMVEAFAQRHAHIAGWRCALAYVYAELDRDDECQKVVDGLAPGGFAAIPEDTLWLLSVAQVVQAVHHLGDTDAATVLYPKLAPYADRCVVNLNQLSWGSVARSLGLLATTLGRFDEAEAHFDHALAVNRGPARGCG